MVSSTPNSAVQERDRQAERQTKNTHFALPGGVETRHGCRGPRARSCASKTIDVKTFK